MRRASRYPRGGLGVIPDYLQSQKNGCGRDLKAFRMGDHRRSKSANLVDGQGPEQHFSEGRMQNDEALKMRQCVQQSKQRHVWADLHAIKPWSGDGRDGSSMGIG